MKKETAIALFAFFAFALVLLAFVPPPASLTQKSGEDTGLVLGVFEGTTPCADCPGIDTRLTLTKDAPGSAEGSYELSLTYLERDVEPFVQTGLWTTERGTPSDPDATVYVLDPDLPDQSQRYVRVDADTIRQLDRDGNEIDASLPFDLHRTSPADSIAQPGPRTLAGTRICLPAKDPNAPQTRECAAGLKADDGENYALDFSALTEEDLNALPPDGRVEVSGTVVPIELLSSDHLRKYDVAGIMSATSIRAI
jgi:copper homeostasis protein (lipoprotein)